MNDFQKPYVLLYDPESAIGFQPAAEKRQRGGCCGQATGGPGRFCRGLHLRRDLRPAIPLPAGGLKHR